MGVNDKIAKLHPAIRVMAQQLIDQAKEQLGIDLRIVQGMRTFDEQQAIYDQGRTKPGKIVSKAKPGQSFHNYGLAIDVCPFVKGKPDWETKLYPAIAVIGKSLGFTWGGEFKGIDDQPHFEFPKTTYKTLLALKNSGKVDKEGYVLLTTLKI